MVAMSVPLGLMLGRLANFINAELWGRPTDLPWGVIFPGQAAQTCGDVVGLCARHPSQLYQATLEGLVLALLLAYLAFRRQALKKTGLITGVFFIGYGIARSFVELFRQPDAQFQSVDNPIGYAAQFFGIGLTMGQLLSIPMIVLGLALVIRAKNK
jgi:phosphatidylglycerol:prolipoprotein diacylglycerol transferase